LIVRSLSARYRYAASGVVSLSLFVSLFEKTSPRVEFEIY